LSSQEKLPKPKEFWAKLGRNAFIGFCASVISDTCSNSIRVIKVYKQSNLESISYMEAARRVIKEDGLVGLFGRWGINVATTKMFVSTVLQGLIDKIRCERDARPHVLGAMEGDRRQAFQEMRDASSREGQARFERTQQCQRQRS
jgi:hypothetical protein